MTKSRVKLNPTFAELASYTPEETAEWNAKHDAWLARKIAKGPTKAERALVVSLIKGGHDLATLRRVVTAPTIAPHVDRIWSDYHAS